jgi:lysophospholipase L1-like esterase
MNLPPETAFQIDFNLCHVPAALGLEVPPSAAAPMLGIAEDDFAAYVEFASAQVREAAGRLLREPQIQHALTRWSPAPRSRILAAGDSITTYRYSYAELLRALLELSRPDDDTRMLNAGQSGFTSTLALEVTYTQLLALDADWVLIMYGVNDCKRFGASDARPLVSRREYAENMRAVAAAFRIHCPRARVVLLTPSPVVESVTNALPAFQASRMTWDNRDIAACGESMRAIAREFDCPCVDLVSAFGMTPDPALYLPDGLHPNFEGQELILREVLSTLAQS